MRLRYARQRHYPLFAITSIRWKTWQRAGGGDGRSGLLQREPGSTNAVVMEQAAERRAGQKSVSQWEIGRSRGADEKQWCRLGLGVVFSEGVPREPEHPHIASKVRTL